jgi:5-formaminoimidazole-4-carboxamide-1-beta-D-ribofuranosyl 5'-monophosphate synthetase
MEDMTHDQIYNSYSLEQYVLYHALFGHAFPQYIQLQEIDMHGVKSRITKEIDKSFRICVRGGRRLWS